MRKGILFIPVSTNGDSMRNVLSVVFNENSKNYNKFPDIGKITFIYTDKVKCGVDDKRNPADMLNGIENVLEAAEISGVELRFRQVKDYAKDIPECVMDGIREVGKDYIILDLTCGKKDITGSLYTAGSVCEIKNMIYVEVKKEGQEFLRLTSKDPDINGKYVLNRFKTMTEIQSLASLNEIDFIMYHSMVAELQQGLEENTKMTSYVNLLDNAISSYFEGKYGNCIRDVGNINEDLLKELLAFLKIHYADEIKNGKMSKKGISLLEGLEDRYHYISNPNNSESKDPEKNKNNEEEKAHLHEFFSIVNTPTEMILLIKCYRNKESHFIDKTPGRKKAKLAMDIMIELLTELKQYKFWDNRSDEDDENE